MQAKIEPLHEEIARVSEPYNRRKRELRQRYEALVTEILEAKTPYSRSELDVSGLYTCAKSPVGWCVFPRRGSEDCVFCGEPEERK